MTKGLLKNASKIFAQNIQGGQKLSLDELGSLNSNFKNEYTNILMDETKNTEKVLDKHLCQVREQQDELY